MIFVFQLHLQFLLIHQHHHQGLLQQFRLNHQQYLHQHCLLPVALHQQSLMKTTRQLFLFKPLQLHRLKLLQQESLNQLLNLLAVAFLGSLVGAIPVWTCLVESVTVAGDKADEILHVSQTFPLIKQLTPETSGNDFANFRKSESLNFNFEILRT